MAETARFTTEDARKIGEALGIDWTKSKFDIEQFRMGLHVELGRCAPVPRIQPHGALDRHVAGELRIFALSGG